MVPIRISPKYGPIAIIESRIGIGISYLNKICMFDALSSLKPATEEQKKIYSYLKNKKNENDNM
jgi:hypothetical protein